MSTHPSSSVDALNKLGSFYLGREYDLAQKTLLPAEVHYEAKDLCTHGVVVGMTGSGKTGLSLALLEEAALDNIPCIMIDPKGDLTNLLLQFPDLEPRDFQRWINPEEAAQKGVSLEEHARQTAQRWRRGIEESGQPLARLAELKNKADFRIYTPGSEAGLPLSILQTFAAPRGNILREDLNQKIDATASALLGLTGISSDPVQSREHILIAQLLLNAWSQGRDIDLPQLISQVQEPPIRKVGALDIDTFYKEKDRLKLAIALNNILAAPSFSTWLMGEPLDLGQLLSGGQKTRQLIFYVAHLDDSQRMFFITLLLSEILSWTRKQTGTTNLRALVYFDEVFGYLPPHPANPPTKQPLMTLFKQARAFGVGVLLATQNPVDIDYKALSNAGTWFVGKLQTERDKARLIDGLEGAAAERGAGSARPYLEKTISALGNRLFLMHNVHRGGEPKVFQTRWALSFLRGPMSREEIATLMAPVKAGRAQDATPHAVPVAPTPAVPPPSVVAPPAPPNVPLPVAIPVAPEPAPLPQAIPVASAQASAANDITLTPVTPMGSVTAIQIHGRTLPTATVRLILPADYPQFYLTVHGSAPAGGALVYVGHAYGHAEVVCTDKKMGRDYRRTLTLLAVAPESGPIDWRKAETISPASEARPRDGALWTEVPATLESVKKIKDLEKAFVDFLQSTKVAIPSNPGLKMSSEPAEEPAAFLNRCQSVAWKEFEKALANDRAMYAAEFARYQAPLPEPPPPAPSLSWEERWQTYQTATPWKATSNTPLTPRQLQQLENLEGDWHREVREQAAKWQRLAEAIQDMHLSPNKKDIRVVHLGLAWVPFWQGAPGTALIPAYRAP